MKNFLVPVDFSEYSENALRAAAALAKKHSAKIYAVHMVGIMPAIVVRMEEKTSEEVKRHLDLAKEDMRQFLDKTYLINVEIESIITINKVFEELPIVAKKVNADLIIMGSHGAKGIEELFVGTNTEKVIRHTDTPILVMKNRLSNMHFENVVFGCDLDAKLIPSLSKVLDFCLAIGSKLHMVYVNTPGLDFESTEEMNGLIEDFLKIAKKSIAISRDDIYIYNDYTIEKGIGNYAKMINADLIAIATHGKKGLSHFFTHSVGETMANHSKLPVIVFKR